MTARTLFLTDELYAYMNAMCLRLSPLQHELIDRTAEMEWAGIESSPEQAQLLQLLVGVTGARRCLELGVFTGFSTLAMASAMPRDGYMIACDTDQTAPTVAREFWARAGVSEKIDLRIGPAINTLKDLLDKGCAGTFDVAYIDADKTNGMAYYELVLLLLRDNGLMAVDNVFWGGQVVSKGHVDRDTFAVRELNERIRRDLRVEVSVVPVGDGMLLARKVPQGDLPGVER